MLYREERGGSIDGVMAERGEESFTKAEIRLKRERQ